MPSISVPAHIKGLIFDCDGTLVDSMPIHWICWHETFAAFGQTCPQEFLDNLKGVPTHRIVMHYNEQFGTSLDVDAFTEQKENLAKKKLLEVKPIEAVADIVRANAGKRPMAVASGGPYATVALSLKAVGLFDYFDAYVTADDPIPPKPDPAFFLAAADRINVDPTACQVFEDSELGFAAAEGGGMIWTDVRPFYGEGQG